MPLKPSQLEGGKQPVNKIRVAAWVTAGLVGIANALTLSGVIPVEIGTQLCVGSTIIIPVILGLASLPYNPRENKLFRDASDSMGPGSSIKSVKHYRLKNKTEVKYGPWEDKDK